MKIKKKNLFLTVTFILLFSNFSVGLSQDRKEVTWHDRLFWGGNIGFQAGTITQIEISPLVGYRITSLWAAGLELKYEYYSQNYNSPKFNTSIYGTTFFTNYTLLRDVITSGLAFIIQGEDEILSLEKRYFNYNISISRKDRFTLNSILIGGGIKEYLGGRSSMFILLLWDIRENIHSPYSNPILKVGFVF